MKVKCKNCEEQVEAKLRPAYEVELNSQGAIVNSTARQIEWLNIECEHCDYYQVVSADFLQPSDPLFERVYGRDPYAEEAKQSIVHEKEDEERMNTLDEKYHGMFRGDGLSKSYRSNLEKDLKREVFRDDGNSMVDEAMARKKEADKKLVKGGK